MSFDNCKLIPNYECFYIYTMPSIIIFKYNNNNTFKQNFKFLQIDPL